MPIRYAVLGSSHPDESGHRRRWIRPDVAARLPRSRCVGADLGESSLKLLDRAVEIPAQRVETLGEGDLAAVNNSFGFGGANVAVAVTNANVSR